MTRLAIDDRGSVTEFVALAPLPFLFLVGVVFVGRYNVAAADVEAATRYAARAISIDRDPASAANQAEAQTATTVHVGSAMCTSMDFTADVQTETVSATISCVVDVSEATILGVPGTLVVTSTATEPIDRYRENSGEFGMSEGSAHSKPSVEAL
jgi:Flp pilus assembly protein TadG